MHHLSILLIATVASFIGSLQAGLVNTAVLATTLRSGEVAGRRMAWGGAVPEFLYAAVAFLAGEWLLEGNGLLRTTLERIAGTVLLGMGLYLMLFLKPFTPDASGSGPTGGFRRGVLVGLMNPQLLVFWCGVRLGMGTVGIEARGWADRVAFGLGAFLGALVLLMILVRVGRRLHAHWRPTSLRLLFRVLGATLVALGLWAWLRSFSLV